MTALQMVGMLAGALVGWLLWQRAAGRPWDAAWSVADRRLARQLSRVVPLVARRADSAVTRDELAQVVAFYTRWLNLPANQRDAHADAMRAAGVDMVRLGDSLRWFRDRR